jgi:quercetin dioxygenase-like cupin family protein
MRASHIWDRVSPSLILVNAPIDWILLPDEVLMSTSTDQETPNGWSHGDIVDINKAQGFSPPGGKGFVLRPLIAKDGEMPTLLLGTLEPAGVIPREIHESNREHLLVLDGEVVYIADDGARLILRPGQMGRLAPNVWHEVRNEGDRVARFLVSLL